MLATWVKALFSSIDKSYYKFIDINPKVWVETINYSVLKEIKLN